MFSSQCDAMRFLDIRLPFLNIHIRFLLLNLLTFSSTVKPVLRGHLWDQ